MRTSPHKKVSGDRPLGAAAPLRTLTLGHAMSVLSGSSVSCPSAAPIGYALDPNGGYEANAKGC